MNAKDRSSIHSRQGFQTTQWNLIRSVDDSDSAIASAALQELCTTYWYPLYAFVRHQGKSSHDAADLTQAFFADLLERNDLQKLQPSQGKFRSFLMVAIKHFMLNDLARSNAQKRGGGLELFSIDHQDADSRYASDPMQNQSSEFLFERQWALTLLEKTNQQLAADYQARDQSDLFEQIKIFLAGRSEETTMKATADQLEMTESAIKVAVHRMRQRFGTILRNEIAKTVDSPDDIDDEIQYLFELLSR